MPALNIFKRKKPEEKKEVKKVEPAKEAEKIKTVKPEKEAVLERMPRKAKDKKEGLAYRILKVPQITEKATDLAEKNEYVFKVFPKANKTEVKKAVEDLYDVDVLSVRTIKVPPKKRRLGRIAGWREGYKKAIVKIKEGQKIEVMPR